ncbi:MAG: radical SAM family heme chaperone HemW [Clostridia bacterium]|nr:radical SAM family heme chaperone HemW [Clostridia bacterium]
MITDPTPRTSLGEGKSSRKNSATEARGGGNPIGLYLHIPFCVRKCNYCDFCSKPPSENDFDKYFERLKSEFSDYKRSPKIKINSLFIGGGTPSLLPLGYFTRLFDFISDTFDFCEDCEITAEINPGTLTEEKAKEYRALGINRISIGLQSIHENELKMLGRIHSFEDFLCSYSLLQSLGFDNISVDLMYGIPEQTSKSLKETLEKITALNPQHISLYGLIIEEGTRFANRLSELNLPSEDEECDMYYLASELLRRAGYSHYEISNYAREGYECRHNLKYWNTDEYIGIGAAAHSFFLGQRYGNTRDLFSVVRDPLANGESDADEYVMMRLRLSDGLSLDEYRKRYGTDFCHGREKLLFRLKDLGLLTLDGGKIRLTERGFYVSNSILTELL